jgi:hypothetical protein
VLQHSPIHPLVYLLYSSLSILGAPSLHTLHSLTTIVVRSCFDKWWLLAWAWVPPCQHTTGPSPASSSVPSHYLTCHHLHGIQYNYQQIDASHQIGSTPWLSALSTLVHAFTRFGVWEAITMTESNLVTVKRSVSKFRYVMWATLVIGYSLCLIYA